jgi:hypothetical protein
VGYKARSIDERQRALVHVGYELTRMVELALRIGPADRAGDKVAADAFLEATLVHARNIIEFLKGGGRYLSDMRPSTFITGWELEPALAERLGDAKADIDRHLSHLTWKRVDDGAVGWPYKNVARQVVEAFRSLVEEAEADVAHGSARTTPMVASVLRTALDAVDDLAPTVTTDILIDVDAPLLVHATASERAVTLIGNPADPLAAALDVTDPD